jgi:hypothetical protein
MKAASKEAEAPWLTYERALFLTLGAFLLGLMAVVWHAQGPHSRHWPWPPFAWALFGLMILVGLFCLGTAILASGDTVEKRAGSLPATGAMIIFRPLAVAVYWAGGLVEGVVRRRCVRAEPGAVPIGGHATPTGNSGVTGGPPSVS